MNAPIAIFLLVAIASQVTHGAVLTCSSSATVTSYAGKYYCLPVDNSTPTACQQCAAGVKYFCQTGTAMSTSSWRRGVKVIDNCGSIAKNTAIATFEGANLSYQGHAAVFVSCSKSTNTIEVYDQWAGQTWHARTIRQTTGSASNNVNSFYVVNY